VEGTCYYFYDLGLYGAYIFIIYLRVTGYSNGVVVSPYTPCCHNVGYTYPSPPSLACHAKLHIHFPEEVAHTPSAFNIANISGSTTSHRFVQLSTTTTCHPYDYTTVKQILKSTMLPAEHTTSPTKNSQPLKTKSSSRTNGPRVAKRRIPQLKTLPRANTKKNPGIEDESHITRVVSYPLDRELPRVCEHKQVTPSCSPSQRYESYDTAEPTTSLASARTLSRIFGPFNIHLQTYTLTSPSMVSPLYCSTQNWTDGSDGWKNGRVVGWEGRIGRTDRLTVRYLAI